MYDVIASKRGVEEACVFARAASIGSQRLPVHWGGDCDSEWTGMAESLRGGLSLTLSGFAYWAHDIGGFKAEGAAGGYALVTPGANIYKRWVPWGLLSSHSRLHGSGSYRVPWLFGDEACTVLSKFTKLKHQLEPYIIDLGIHDAIERGYPLMRAMFLEFPRDQTSWYLDTQYMFGDKLLVAPVFDDSHVDYYLPDAGGDWVNLLTGDRKSGGRWYSEDFDYLTLPVLLCHNSVLVMGREKHRFGKDVAESGLLVVISDTMDTESSTVVHRRNGRDITVSAKPTRAAASLRAVDISVDGLPDETEIEVLVIGGGCGLDTASPGRRKKLGRGKSIHLDISA